MIRIGKQAQMIMLIIVCECTTLKSCLIIQRKEKEIKMIYLIISEDGRTFYDEDEPEEIIKKVCIPIKAIFNDKMELVWRKENGTN